MDALVTCAGIVGAAAFGGMMIPQVIHNHRRSSTAGLSAGLVVLWHLAALLYIAYALAERESLWVVTSMGCFCATLAVLEAQELTFARNLERWLWPLALLLSALSVAASAALGTLLRTAPLSALFAFGTVLPSMLFAAGFFPQFFIFIRRRSIAGYSFLVTFIDVLGSGANTVVIGAQMETRDMFFVSSAPFITIIGLHVVLLLIAAAVILSKAEPEHAGDAPLSAELRFHDAVEVRPPRGHVAGIRKHRTWWEPLTDGSSAPLAFGSALALDRHPLPPVTRTFKSAPASVA